MATRWSLGPVTMFWRGRHPGADMFRWFGISIGTWFVGIARRGR